MFLKGKKKILFTLFLSSALFALFSCAKNTVDENMSSKNKDSISNYIENDAIETDDTNFDKQNGEITREINVTETTEIVDEANKDIEYDVYKKIDLSEFVHNSENGQFIDHNGGGIFLSNGPCKITIKADVKIERGPGLSVEDINDALAVSLFVGPVNADVYYADYNGDFFGTFHEIERSEEFYNGSSGSGKIWFSNLGIKSLNGSSGWKEEYVSNNDTEYVGEFLNQEKTQTKLKVTIKDIYYKINKPTGTVTEWDLNKDFTLSSFNNNQCFDMRELDADYNYILRPKFTVTENDGYQCSQVKYLNFLYISNEDNPEYCTKIMNERENQFSPRYNRIGVGATVGNWREIANGQPIEVDLSYDKNSKTITAKSKSGIIAGTIKIDYIKEYKYKNFSENTTSGYKRYVMATNQNESNYDVEMKDAINSGIAMDIYYDDTNQKAEEIENRKITYDGYSEIKTLKIGDHDINYKTPLCYSKIIPNLQEVIDKSVELSLEAFFNLYYEYCDKEIDELRPRTVNLPKYDYTTKNNFLYILYGREEKVDIYIELCKFWYSYSGYWFYRKSQDTIAIDENSKNHGYVNRSLPRGNNLALSTHLHIFNKLGYEPIITDWYYLPIKDTVPIEEAKPGDNIVFGKYYFENKAKLDDLNWIVLDKIDDEIFITTKYAISSTTEFRTNSFMKKYGRNDQAYKNYLNNVFYDEAFNSKEKKMIINHDYSSDTDINENDIPKDKVFLLSYDEASKYFNSDSSRQCKATCYAKYDMFCWYSIIDKMCGNCWYFLRTPGYDYGDGVKHLMFVNQYGKINTTGELPIFYSDIGIRPAMWVSIGEKK